MCRFTPAHPYTRATAPFARLLTHTPTCKCTGACAPAMGLDSALLVRARLHRISLSRISRQLSRRFPAECRPRLWRGQLPQLGRVDGGAHRCVQHCRGIRVVAVRVVHDRCSQHRRGLRIRHLRIRNASRTRKGRLTKRHLLAATVRDWGRPSCLRIALTVAEQSFMYPKQHELKQVRFQLRHATRHHALSPFHSWTGDWTISVALCMHAADSNLGYI
eukprot:269262-Pleurochrysis_carterae.AAC.1